MPPVKSATLPSSSKRNSNVARPPTLKKSTSDFSQPNRAGARSNRPSPLATNQPMSPSRSNLRSPYDSDDDDLPLGSGARSPTSRTANRSASRNSNGRRSLSRSNTPTQSRRSLSRGRTPSREGQSTGGGFSFFKSWSSKQNQASSSRSPSRSSPSRPIISSRSASMPRSPASPSSNTISRAKSVTIDIPPSDDSDEDTGRGRSKRGRGRSTSNTTKNNTRSNSRTSNRSLSRTREFLTSKLPKISLPRTPSLSRSRSRSLPRKTNSLKRSASNASMRSNYSTTSIRSFNRFKNPNPWIPTLYQLVETKTFNWIVVSLIILEIFVCQLQFIMPLFDPATPFVASPTIKALDILKTNLQLWTVIRTTLFWASYGLRIAGVVENLLRFVSWGPRYFTQPLHLFDLALLLTLLITKPILPARDSLVSNSISLLRLWRLPKTLSETLEAEKKEFEVIIKGQQQTWEDLLMFEKRKREEAEKELRAVRGKMDLLLGSDDIKSEAAGMTSGGAPRFSQAESLSGLVPNNFGGVDRVLPGFHSSKWTFSKSAGPDFGKHFRPTKLRIDAPRLFQIFGGWDATERHGTGFLRGILKHRVELVITQKPYKEILNGDGNTSKGRRATTITTAPAESKKNVTIKHDLAAALEETPPQYEEKLRLQAYLDDLVAGATVLRLSGSLLAEAILFEDVSNSFPPLDPDLASPATQRTMRLPSIWTSPIWALLTLTASTIVSATLYEPADGKFMIGAWLDTESTTTNPDGGNSPSLFNTNLGNFAAAFQFEQEIPILRDPTGTQLTANVTLVQSTLTDAIMIVTVRPRLGFDGYTAADVSALADQLNALTSPTGSSRRIILRFAPEMNGNWNPAYGQRPNAFKRAYIDVVNAIRAKTNRVSFMWSPNAGNNYPFGRPLPGYELSALDTNGDGRLDNNDDPYTPYWPGAEYVDWIGVSLYWKGFIADGFPQTQNKLAPSDFMEQMIIGGPEGSNPRFKLYDFCTTYNKPLMMSEGGTAFHTSLNGQPLSPGPGRLAVLRSFWSTFLNPTFLDKYPRFKMFVFFEYMKRNEDGEGVDNDYRISTFPDVMQAFRGDLSVLGNRVVWAGRFVPGLDPLRIGGGATGAGGVPEGESGGGSGGAGGGAGGRSEGWKVGAGMILSLGAAMVAALMVVV
ncbi:hypothetical protein HDV05_005364 [Chytridiales sp. JEL 0842]|nr:hypothetical protein HDV05_005364 [Chytridiales sp. JEL 0842]